MLRNARAYQPRDDGKQKRQNGEWSFHVVLFVAIFARQRRDMRKPDDEREASPPGMTLASKEDEPLIT